jgi:H+/Cl- antiporter ClcA
MRKLLLVPVSVILVILSIPAIVYEAATEPNHKGLKKILDALHLRRKVTTV